MDYLRQVVLYSSEPELLDTAGALKKQEVWLKDFNETGDFVVLNGDTISNVDLADMIKKHRKSKTIATVFTKDTIVHNGGVFIFNLDILDYIPEGKPYSIHRDLFPDLIKKKIPINEYRSDAYYFDCGTSEKLKKARKFFEK